MANNIIKRVWNQNTMVRIEELNGMTFQQEDGGHTFQISGVDDQGNAVPLSGTVAGVFLRSDNANVAISGTTSEGVASITLTEECYVLPGRFLFTVFVTSDGQKTVVYAATGTVTRTSGDTITPEVESDVVDLINRINEAVATIPADYTDLWTSIAPAFSTSATYSAGSYVTYDGNVYCFINAHTGSWNPSDVVAVNVGGELSEINSSVSDLQEETSDLPTIRNDISEAKEDIEDLEEATTDLPTMRTNISSLQRNAADLKSTLNEQQNGTIKGVIRFDTDGYYTAANTISTTGTNKCCEIVIPSNMKRFEFTIKNLLPSSLRLMYLLDKNKNLIAEIDGRTSGLNVVELAAYPAAVYAQCNMFGVSDNYYYDPPTIIYYQNENSLDANGIQLAAERTGKPVECTFTAGKFIHKDGTVTDSGKQWLISSPIHLNTGEELFLKASGYLSIISMITKCDANGENIVPVVISSCVESEVKEYSFKATGSEYVKLCFDSDQKWSAVISDISRDVTDNIASTGEIIYGYWCHSSESGGISALADGAYIKIPVTSGMKYISVAYPTLGTNPESISNLFTGRALFFNSQNTRIASYRPQDYAVPTPCDGVYYATYSVPTGASYFCVTAKLSTWDESKTIIIVNGKTINYIGKTINAIAGVPFSDKKLREKFSYVSSNDWSNKTWLMVGDSLTDKNIRAAISYYDYIADDTGINFINKGHNGQGYMRGTWFYNALSDDISGSDFDFCTFFGSGNDCYYWDGSEVQPYTDAQWPGILGSVSDTGTSTICGNINRTFDRFIELYPLKKFGVITPTPWEEQSNGDGTINGTHMDDYVNKIMEICERRGIPYLDLYHKSGLRPWNEAFRNAYYSNDEGGGVHPDSNGHKWIYPMFKEFLRQFVATP